MNVYESRILNYSTKKKLNWGFVSLDHQVIALVYSYGGDGTGWWTLDNTLSKLW